MNKKSELGESMIISQSNKYPSLFGWKVASLFLCISTIALIFVCTGMLMYLGLNAPPKTDFTFLNSIIIESQIIKTKAQVLKIAQNLKAANQDMKYKFCDKQKTFKSSDLFQRGLMYEIFEKSNDDVLFIMELKSVENLTYSNIFGVFVDSSFPVPDKEDFQEGVRYFTFDIRDQDQKQTTYFAISSDLKTNYLKFNGTADTYDTCEIYSLGTTNFGLLSSLNITYTNSNQTLPEVNVFSKSHKCFFPSKDTQQDFNNALKELLGDVDWSKKIVLNHMEAYHLY